MPGAEEPSQEGAETGGLEGLKQVREAVVHSKADQTEGPEGLTGGGADEGEEFPREGKEVAREGEQLHAQGLDQAPPAGKDGGGEPKEAKEEGAKEGGRGDGSVHPIAHGLNHAQHHTQALRGQGVRKLEADAAKGGEEEGRRGGLRRVEEEEGTVEEEECE